MVRTVMVLLLGWLLAATPAGATEPDVGAELERLAAIRGPTVDPGGLDDRAVLVAFFASWCPPCREEFVHLNTVQAAYGADGLVVVGVNVFETFDGLSTPAKLEVFLDETAPAFPILEGDRATRQAFFDLDRIPSMFLFGRDGRLALAFKHERGAEKTHLTEAELRAAVEPLL